MIPKGKTLYIIDYMQLTDHLKDKKSKTVNKFAIGVLLFAFVMINK